MSSCLNQCYRSLVKCPKNHTVVIYFFTIFFIDTIPNLKIKISMQKIQKPLDDIENDVERALTCLHKGDLIGLPTETVYGLGANALRDEAIAQIYALKKRPQFNPLIAHFASAKHAQEYVQFNQWASQLAAVFWPGPLTLILPQKKNTGLSKLAAAGLDTLAVRVPAHPLAQKILQNVPFPLAAPSANPSCSLSPTTAQHVKTAFPDLFVLEGGPCTVGLESTILDLTGKAPVILRPGFLTESDIHAVLFTDLAHNTDSTIKAPGQLKRHYAPGIPIRPNITHLDPGEALLSFGPHGLTGAVKEINLSPSGNLQDAAATLFSALAELDTPEHTGIAAMPIPNHGIGLAINDRLKRASSLV